MARSLKRFLMLAGLALLVCPVLAQAMPAPPEAEAEAVMLENLAKFVSWPAVSLPYPHSPLVIGVIGDDPFGSALEHRSVHGHPLRVVHLQWNDSPRGCHILFIGVSAVDHLGQILESVAGAPVLTVADFDTFASRGGGIELKRIGDRLRFDINEGAAKTSGLRISSRLLALAARVHPGGRH